MVALVGSVCFADDNQEQYVMDSVWGSMTDEQKYNADIKYKANAVRLSVEDFELFAKCVEAESDRSDFNPNETTDGRVYVAACIWDRVYSDEFPTTVRGVLTEPGQFTTVSSSGNCRINSTLASEWAILVGRLAVLNGEIPDNMYYFNCRGYFSGWTRFDKVGDNYFSTSGSPTYRNKENTDLDIPNTLVITRGDEGDGCF
jgi:spore germination cell wall hydrolase CwlJ-like protein